MAELARALEHIHLEWAIIGWIMRLPLVLVLIQLLVDSVGGEPRPIGENQRDRAVDSDGN